MAQDVLERLLDGNLPDPDGGPPLSIPTRRVAIADSLDGSEAELVVGLALGEHLAVVSDENTRAVLGERVLGALGGAGRVTDIRLPGRPHADGETVEAVRHASKSCDALIAVGSGTINDVCKYAAARDGKPYAVFATAPSMNGYTSVNAAISIRGHKKSLPATAAKGVFMDLTVLSQAPPRMIRSGLGDSVCRSTAQADWLLAHLLLDRPYREAPFVLLAEDEAQLFAGSEALMAGDLGVMRRLARTLTLSGFGMTICGGSYPASEGEHLISHYVEMLAPPEWPEAFHGEQIGVTTLSMARLQERLLEGGPPRLEPSAPDESSITAHFGADLGAACWAEFQGKRLDAERVEALNGMLTDGWDEIRARLRAVVLPATRLEAVLQAAGAPTTPEELGWPRNFYSQALCHAREIRNRYTFLDLAADSGALQDADIV
ncbi:MAG: iron-containing alcohol dehydrogenase [Gammaproteobacteria bacterium]|nr:iron-containing alcohol dehydrogenase [Gammaproteobacteria bacterium]